jgi:hypothetical protein
LSSHRRASRHLAARSKSKFSKSDKSPSHSATNDSQCKLPDIASGPLVIAIRAGDTDGHAAIIADPNWSSLLNTRANAEYTSTHKVLGGASSEVLRRYFHNDDVPSTSTSEVPFAGLMRSFTSFSQAVAENGYSRIYAGIHFRSAVGMETKEGEKIGHFVFRHCSAAAQSR